MRIPFVDLTAQYHAHKGEFDAAFACVIKETAFIAGEPAKEFERKFSKAYGTRNCISCGNGTDALYIVLRMLGIGAGDEVITTAASWISTSETISQTGALPVFVDVDDYYLMDIEHFERAITPRTRAVIPVHLYGQAAPMDRILQICNERGIQLIEDCAQAHFAQWNGRRVGTFGAAGTFSFYPGKNLGAWGDAGAIITDDDALANKCRMFANHGALIKHEHQIEGINSRMDGLQASLLSAKLNHIDSWTEERRRVAALYDRLLSGIGDLAIPKIRSEATHVYHLYVIATAHRDALKAFLAKRGVETAVHYPTALPLLPAYRHLGVSATSIPRATTNQSRILSLPIYAEMTNEMIEYVSQSIAVFFAHLP